jgi:plasmid maintenance system antidote protein VapI
MYKNLMLEMAKEGISNEQIAEETGMHRNSVANKISGVTDFTVQQAVTIRNRFFANIDFMYLYKRFPVQVKAK